MALGRAEHGVKSGVPAGFAHIVTPARPPQNLTGPDRDVAIRIGGILGSEGNFVAAQETGGKTLIPRRFRLDGGNQAHRPELRDGGQEARDQAADPREPLAEQGTGLHVKRIGLAIRIDGRLGQRHA